AFVAAVHRQFKAPFQLAGEGVREVGDALAGAVHVQGVADHQRHRLPAPDEDLDGGPVYLAVPVAQALQRRRGAREMLPHGHPDTLLAKSKPQNVAGAAAFCRRHAWPMSVDSLLRSSPSMRAADSQRRSDGVRKMMLVSAGPLSQAFSLISCSS